MTPREENGIIESTYLGREDHGILTCYVSIKFADYHQGFGGFGFDEFHKPTDRRIGTAWGMEFVARVLDTLGVKGWEKLPGTCIRVRRVNEGPGSQIVAIGHIVENKWFTPKLDLASLLGEAVGA